jgi:hypothetical protein
MKKIVIVLALIFVGMANAMQRSLLDGNDMPKYAVPTDPEEIAYLEDIEDLYKWIQQEDVQSESHTGESDIENIFSYLNPAFPDCSQSEDVQSYTQEERTSGPGIEQIKPAQNHTVEPFERNLYLTEHENDEKKEVSAASLIFGFLQGASVVNVEKQQDRAIADRQEKKLESMQSSFLWRPEEESNPRKRTFEEAVASDARNRGFSKEPVVSNTSKKVARKSSTSSKNMKICGINGCQYHATVMKDHQKTPHEQKQCPYPGCAFYHQSQGELFQHIKRSHPEKSCPLCGYASELRSNLLRHLQQVKHCRVPKNPASINLGKGKIA